VIFAVLPHGIVPCAVTGATLDDVTVRYFDGSTGCGYCETVIKQADCLDKDRFLQGFDLMNGEEATRKLCDTRAYQFALVEALGNGAIMRSFDLMLAAIMKPAAKGVGP